MRPDHTHPQYIGELAPRATVLPPAVTRRGSGVSPDYLTSDELILFIVRFGLRLTASRWGMSERTLRRLYEALGTSSRVTVRDFRRLEDLPPLAAAQTPAALAGHLGFRPERIFSRRLHLQVAHAPTVDRRIDPGTTEPGSTQRAVHPTPDPTSQEEGPSIDDDLAARRPHSMSLVRDSWNLNSRKVSGTGTRWPGLSQRIAAPRPLTSRNESCLGGIGS